MLKKTNFLALALFVTSSLSVQAAVITDNYIGGDDHGYGDVIGGISNFEINSMNVNLNGTVLSVSIDTTFAGKAGTIAPSLTNGFGIGYGDLFLSSQWNPNGSGANQYINDNAATGTVWTYGVSLDDRFRTGLGMGAGTLYSLNSADNNADALLAEEFLTGGAFRNGQEVAVDTASSGVQALANAAGWNVTANSVDFTIDLANTALLSGGEIALHWGFTCQNDVIEGSLLNTSTGASAVPIPPAAWLFATGLIGLVGVSRRKS